VEAREKFFEQFPQQFQERDFLTVLWREECRHVEDICSFFQWLIQSKNDRVGMILAHPGRKYSGPGRVDWMRS